MEGRGLGARAADVVSVEVLGLVVVVCFARGVDIFRLHSGICIGSE